MPDALRAHKRETFLSSSRGRRKRRPMKTSELIARDIIHDIAESGLEQGDALPPEATMLQHYGVGRASLREALRLLEVNGLVRIRAGAKGGPVVGAASAESLAQMLTLYFGIAGATYEELMEVILSIYPLIAESAASQKLKKAEKEALMNSVEQSCGVTAVSAADTENLEDFHYLLSEYSGFNTINRLFVDAIAMIFTDHVMASQDSSDFHGVCARDHQEIAEAVLEGEPARAKQAMHDHTVRMIEFYRSKNAAIFSQLIEWR
ncbi:MAG: FadR/GntR family transcriptional regulator [Parahaliea sp.]